MESYSKPPLTYDQQLSLLEDRGLIIENRSVAESFLKNVSYYRFSAYCIPFESNRHKFKPDIKFENIEELYEFDCSLRSIIDEALALIEIFLRSTISYYLVHKYGIFAHEDGNCFFMKNKHPEWIEKVHNEILKSREVFVSHYKEKYEGYPKLPLWMTIEIMSLGMLSTFYSNLLRDDQIAIAKEIGINCRVLGTWLHTFTYVRNICAHHGRLWNRDLSISMALPKNSVWDDINSRRIASVIFAINYFIYTQPLKEYIKRDWHLKINSLLIDPIKVDNFYGEIGLPENFTNHELWEINS